MYIKSWNNYKINEKAVRDYPFNVIYSDGVVAQKGVDSEKQAIDFAKELTKKPKMQRVEVFKNASGFHSTTQDEYLIAWWGDGGYFDNRSKKEPKLLDKKLVIETT